MIFQDGSCWFCHWINDDGNDDDNVDHGDFDDNDDHGDFHYDESHDFFFIKFMMICVDDFQRW